tara:strand:- start:10399 stop:10743 length:345 start_codon:yes stop_codon:yes gene_type:complete
MKIDLLHIILFLTSVVSMGVIIFLYKYIKKVLLVAYIASEESSEIFTRLESYGSHLQSVYEMPMFYGDDTLQSLLDHTKDLVKFFDRYDAIYSFTQPDLLEQLEGADVDPKEKV